jgi:hypothetical protein
MYLSLLTIRNFRQFGDGSSELKIHLSHPFIPSAAEILEVLIAAG